MRIELLGPLQVRVGAAAAAFRTDAERVLLAYLAAHQGIPQRRDTLAGLLSPDRPDTEALTYLRNRLTRLRDAIGDENAIPPWLDIDRKQITLRTGDDIGVDVTKFGRLLTTVESHPHRQLAGCPTCLAHLQEAVDFVRGEFLAGLNFPSDTWETWLIAQREHVQQRVLEAMTHLREAQIARGEWAAVLDIAQRQLRLEPWLEAAHRALMQAHAHLGDRNAALAQYVLCAEKLGDELGVEPEAATQQLYQQISDHALVVPGQATIPDNLPLATGLFFGRTTEQTQLLQRLVDPAYRLVTLVGTGGIGKTRLAVEVGQQVKLSFPDGVWFVSLDALEGDTERIKMAVGEAVGLGQAGKQLTGEQVLALLRDKRLLLILDNCEVALDELGFIPEWLRRAPQVAILATSREPLNFQAESVILLDGLPRGETGLSAAASLFADRGRMARDDFAVTAANLPQVHHICDLVDGSPLGIALAAAWVRRRSLAQIITSIGESLDFLTTRLRDVDPRHRSMRAVFETSWQLLTPGEQAVLAALSVFPTTFTADAAAEIAQATPFDLDLLCEKSLLQQQHEPERYGLHSLVRQFAAAKLASRTPELNRGFVRYFYQFAREHRADYAELQPEWRNFAAAITKAHSLAEWQWVLDWVQVLAEPWFRQIRFNEMREGLTLALDAAAALPDDLVLARLLLRLGEVEMELNAYAAATEHLAAAMQKLTRWEDSLGIAQAEYLYGRILSEQGRDEEALAQFEASKRIFAEEQDGLGIAKNLNLIAVYHFKQNRDFQTAQTCLEQALALQRPLPVSSTTIETWRYLARVQSMAGDYLAAEVCLVEALKVSRQQEDKGEYAAALYEKLLLHKKQQQFEAALAVGYECLDLFHILGSLRLEGLVKTQLGLLHQARQEPHQGLPLLLAGLDIFCELGDLFEQAYSYYYLSQLYAEMGDMAQSLNAKQQARQLNLTLNNPRLAERLQ